MDVEFADEQWDQLETDPDYNGVSLVKSSGLTGSSCR
jgi:hypothetical protein